MTVLLFFQEDFDWYCGPATYNFVVIIMTGVCLFVFQETVDGYQGPIAYNFVLFLFLFFSGRLLMGTKDPQYITLLL